MEHDGLGWGEQKESKKVKGRGQEGDNGGGEIRYELKLRRMENEWGCEELDWIQAPFHTESL